jgi:DNA polymerase-3 subunit epsilon
MIENILILDTETTGLDPSKGAKVIEVGAILFNVKYKQMIQTLSTLFSCNENPVQEINKIDPLWTKASKSEVSALNFLDSMCVDSSYIVAHNSEFDKKFMNTLNMGKYFHNKHWICTKRDFKWPVQLFRMRLQDICEAYNIEYVNAHRALSDCNLLAECLKNVDDLGERLERAANITYKNSYTNRYT